MEDTTRYMRVELPADYEKTERVVIYGTNNTEIEVSSDLLVTADEISREGEGYTAEEYREVLKAIYDMDPVERKNIFGVSTLISGYIKDFSVSALIKKYRAYKNIPKVGEYWKKKENGKMVVVRYVKNNIVYVYLCDGGNTDYCPLQHFADNYTRTEYKSKYLGVFFEEMKEVSK